MTSAPDILRWLKNEEDKTGGQLWQLSQEIWKNPELKFKEQRAHEVLTRFLEDKGFVVHRNYALPTAFKAELPQSENALPGPCIALLCEYDALPLIGHCCGHNLIAEVGVAAALALNEIANKRPEGLPGKVVVLGTPAEEGGGGKIQLINKGAFDDLDAVLMAHPGSGQNVTSSPILISSLQVDIEYQGRASHAAGKPWDGLNALDAAVACYVNVALLKQQIKPDWRVNGIFTNGGQAYNVVPRESSLSFLLRAPKTEESKMLLERFLKCASAAGEATGCQSNCDVHWDNHYKSLKQNGAIEERYKKHSVDLGMTILEGIVRTTSTDFGNVSHLVPGLHPYFGIGTNSFPHTEDFGVRAGSYEAQEATLTVAAALAATAADLLLDHDLLTRAKMMHNDTTSGLDK